MKVLSPSDLKCPTTGKAAYASRSRAEKVMERAWTDPSWENRHGSPPTTVYKCPACAWWHLGRGKKGRKHGTTGN